MYKYDNTPWMSTISWVFDSQTLRRTIVAWQPEKNDILSMRLPNFEEDDYIAWQLEKNGIFTVRSAYRLAMDEKRSEIIGWSHNISGDWSIWNTIWKTNVPQKVRIFMWRPATESLSIQTNRFWRIPGLTSIWMFVALMTKRDSMLRTHVCLREPSGMSWRTSGTSLQRMK